MLPSSFTTTQILVFLLFLFYCLYRLLLKYPTLLWSSTPLDPVRDEKILKVRTVAHRGGRVTTIENTLSSFKNAYKNNMDMIELDVHLTADKQVVVFHDDTLWRMTKKKFQMKSTINDLLKKVSLFCCSKNDCLNCHEILILVTALTYIQLSHGILFFFSTFF